MAGREEITMSTTTKNLAQIALMAAVMCILGPISLPIGPVPISLTPLAIFLGVYILGAKKGTIAVIVYLLIGLCGIPVFSGFSGGPGKLFGPTGGYLVAYILTAVIAGVFIDKFYHKIYLQAVGMILGLAVLYLIGTIWLAYQANMTFQAALAAGVIPFVALDLIKIAAAIVLGRAVRTALTRAGFLDRADAAA